MNRTGVVAVATLVSTAGLSPVVAFLDRPWLYVPIAVAALVGVGIRMRLFTSASTARPSITEFLLGGLHSALVPAFAGLLWLAVYGAIYWSLRGLGEVGVSLDPARWGFVVSTALGLPMLAILAHVGILEPARNLYPDLAGVPSRYAEVIAGRRRDALIGLGWLVLVALGVVAVWLLEFEYEWAIDAILLLLLGTAASKVEMPRQAPVSTLHIEATGTVQQAFERAGYDVIPYPRTGREDVDPLLTSVDLFARKGEHAFAVEVKSSPVDGEELEWTATTGLVAATRALNQLELEGIKDVDPALVLINVAPGSSLQASSADSVLPLIQVDEHHGRVEILNDRPGRMLHDVARNFLRLDKKLQREARL